TSSPTPSPYTTLFRSNYRSPLKFDDGTDVKTPADWRRRRREIRADWERLIGAWPDVVDKPAIEYVETKRRENFTQHRVRVETARSEEHTSELQSQSNL